MRATYTNSIITFFLKAQNQSYHMTYAVKTVENLFTWCGECVCVCVCVYIYIY